MEGADVELVAQFGFGLGPHLLDLDHTYFVCGRLTRHHDIALHFRTRLTFGDRRIGKEVLHSLLFGPAFGVQSGIDHETDRAPDFRAKAPEIRVRISIGSGHFLGELFRIQAPAFRIGRKPGLRAELRHTGQLLGNRDLHVVTRQALMIGNHFQLALGHGFHVQKVSVVDARTRSIRRARIVMLGGTRLLAEGLHTLHYKVGLGQDAEIVRQHSLDLLDRGCGVIDIGLTAFVGVRIIVLRVVLVIADAGEELVQRAFKADLGLDGFHLAMNAINFREAEIVDFVRRHAGGRHLRQHEVIECGAVRLGADTLRAGRIGRVCKVFLRKGDDVLVHRLEIAGEGGFGFGDQRGSCLRGRLACVHKGLNICLEVGEDRAVRTVRKRRAGDQLLRFGNYGLIGELRRVHALASLVLGLRQQFLQPPGAFGDTLHIGAGIGLLVHRMELHEEGRHEGVHAAHLVEDQAVVAEVDGLRSALILVDPEIVGILVGGRKLLVVEGRFQLIDGRFRLGQLLILAGDGQTVDLVILVLAAKEGQLDRAILQLFFIFGIEPSVQLLAERGLFFSRKLGRGGRLGRLRRARAEYENEGESRHSAAQHGESSGAFAVKR